MSRVASASKAGPVAAVSSPNKAKIHIIYYSLFGHVATMAKAAAKGVEAAGGEARLIQIPETLSQEVLTKMSAPEKDKTIPTITFGEVKDNTVSLEEALVNCDGILLGFPTRFGGIPAQVKAFWDSTGALWMKGALVGKPISVFFSTGTQGGGQETTALTSFTNYVHHGMIIVPVGYSCPLQTNMDEIHGGSPYGAGTYAGPNRARQPSQIELQLAEHQGSHFTKIAAALKIGRAALQASAPESKPAEAPPKADRPPSAAKK